MRLASRNRSQAGNDEVARTALGFPEPRRAARWIRGERVGGRTCPQDRSVSRGASRAVNGHCRCSARIRGSGGFSFGTPDALRATALLLFLREATSPDARPVHPALSDLVASAPYVSWQRALTGAFDQKGAATYSDTSVAPIEVNMLHALTRPRSLGREELPARGRKVRRVGGRFGVWEEGSACGRNLRRMGRASHADDELPARAMTLPTRTMTLPHGR
jgi:hypothetical protein